MSEPIGYFITALFLVSGTCFALAPRKWAGAFPLLGLFLSVFNELPFCSLFFMIASTWLAFAEGDIDSLLGWISFALILAAMIGTGLIIKRGVKASGVVTRALDENLDHWRSAAHPGIKKFSAKALLGPFLVRNPVVNRIANISYGDGGRRNLLDVYQHRSRPLDAPVLIHLHGGRFVSGKKDRQSLPLIYHFASRGWVCISANYRLSPGAQFPDQLIDLKKVIAWVRENGAAYHADPSKIFVAGNSAGGYLAAMAALTTNDAAFQPGFEGVDTSISGAISLYGYYGALSSKNGQPSSPVDYSAVNAPPFFVAHGDRDTMIGVESARNFVQHLRTSSAHPVIYTELPGAEHTFDFVHSIRNEAVISGIAAFTDRVLTHTRDRQRQGEEEL